jgi:bifunctional non-homologous end joining protein LigD
VDWSQNDEHKTTISVYSLRARERQTVSTPITWDEVERTLKKKNAGLLVFESHKTLERVEKLGDLFAPLLTLKQKLPKLGALGATQPEAISEIAAQESRKPTATSALKARAAKPPSRRRPSRSH